MRRLAPATIGQDFKMTDKVKVELELNDYLKLVSRLGFAEGALRAIGWRLDEASAKDYSGDMRKDVQDCARLTVDAANEISGDLRDVVQGQVVCNPPAPLRN